MVEVVDLAAIDTALEDIFAQLDGGGSSEVQDTAWLQGGLVRISGVQRPLRLVDGYEVPPEDVNGVCGRCTGWVSGTKYVVDTFDGYSVEVKEENLSPYFPPSGEDGGFDALWPSASFEADVTGALTSRGHCVVQPFVSKMIHIGAVTEVEKAGSRLKFKDYPSKIESDAVLGSETETGAMPVPSDELENQSDLPYIDDMLSQMLSELSPMFPDHLGFTCWGRSPPMLRKPYGAEAPPVLSKPFEVSDKKGMEEFYLWLMERKLCMMYFIDSEGGTLELQPASSSASASNIGKATIPVVTGRLVIFRHDLLSYSYQPIGKSNLALQAWAMTEPQQLTIRQIDNPPKPQADMIHVMSAMERFPAGCYGADKVWSLFFSGTDAQVLWPASRWEMEPYYMPERDAPLYGKSDTKHGSFLDYDHLVCFNNKLFGITDDEAKCIEPPQRMVLETCYEALHKAGYNQQTLLNQPIGTFVGDYGSEWSVIAPGMTGYDHRQTININTSSVLTCRVAHVLGLRGPQLHCDTACSASLIGLNAACRQMKWDGLGHAPTMQSAVCLGIVCMLGPHGYIGQSAMHMLSAGGRCRTFDQSADGQNRGEGCSAVNIQSCPPWEQTEMDDKGRLAVVAGTSSNQDGKSASLTAPSGTAQAELHRLSLREAMLSPAELSFAELHGTGTPLGDAIEFGANRTVFSSVKRGDVHCMMSAKAHLGHLEPGAGICGLIKTCMMLLHTCVTPCPHLYQLNANFELGGYPVNFGNEQWDIGKPSAYGGISSFAAYGSNARADIWARALRGPRKQGKACVLNKSEAFKWLQDAVTENKFPKLVKPKLRIEFAADGKGDFLDRI